MVLIKLFLWNDELFVLWVGNYDVIYYNGWSGMMLYDVVVFWCGCYFLEENVGFDVGKLVRVKLFWVLVGFVMLLFVWFYWFFYFIVCLFFDFVVRNFIVVFVVLFFIFFFEFLFFFMWCVFRGEWLWRICVFMWLICLWFEFDFLYCNWEVYLLYWKN